MAINLKEDIKPISYIKTNAAEMMKYVNERNNLIVITQNGEAKAVLVDIDIPKSTGCICVAEYYKPGGK
jgi:prevent-host-death family protein